MQNGLSNELRRIARNISSVKTETEPVRVASVRERIARRRRLVALRERLAARRAVATDKIPEKVMEYFISLDESGMKDAIKKIEQEMEKTQKAVSEAGKTSARRTVGSRPEMSDKSRRIAALRHRLAMRRAAEEGKDDAKSGDFKKKLDKLMKDYGLDAENLAELVGLKK